MFPAAEVTISTGVCVSEFWPTSPWRKSRILEPADTFISCREIYIGRAKWVLGLLPVYQEKGLELLFCLQQSFDKLKNQSVEVLPQHGNEHHHLRHLWRSSGCSKTHGLVQLFGSPCAGPFLLAQVCPQSAAVFPLPGCCVPILDQFRLFS